MNILIVPTCLCSPLLVTACGLLCDSKHTIFHSVSLLLTELLVLVTFLSRLAWEVIFIVSFMTLYRNTRI